MMQQSDSQKDWKVRQKVFHLMMAGVDLGDSSSDHDKIIEEYDEDLIVQRALEYPHLQRESLYYPGKSYAVAVTFAKLLEKHFNEDFYKALKDKDLLYGSDPYFKPYDECSQIYDAIIEQFPWELLEGPQSATPDYRKTLEYFEKEFLLHEETKGFITS